MHIYSETLTLSDLASMAEAEGITLYNPTSHGIKARGKWANRHHMSTFLRPIDGSDAHRAIGYKGQPLWAIDWEGHRRWMERLFNADPNAILDSALARYEGRDSFNRLFHRTSPDINRGYRGKISI